MTTGMRIVVTGVMKPIPTLYKPLQSVDIETKETFNASIERSDSCAVPAASVVMEHVVAFEIAKAILEQFPQDRKSTRLNSSHVAISYAVFCLKKKKNKTEYESTNYTHMSIT